MTYPFNPIAQAVRTAISELADDRAHERFHSPEGQRERAEQVSRELRDVAFHDPTVAAHLHHFLSGDASLLEAVTRAIAQLSEEKQALRKELLSFSERYGGSSRSIFATEPGSQGVVSRGGSDEHDKHGSTVEANRSMVVA